jgi:hypothetical protein
MVPKDNHTAYKRQPVEYVDFHAIMLENASGDPVSLPCCCAATTGEVAEWSKAAVLKTVDPQGSVGSNPTLSANHR